MLNKMFSRKSTPSDDVSPSDTMVPSKGTTAGGQDEIPDISETPTKAPVAAEPELAATEDVPEAEPEMAATEDIPELHDETKDKATGPTFVVVDGTVPHHNDTVNRKHEETALDTSLHTTSSDESVNLSVLLNNDRDEPKESSSPLEVELSLKPSEVNLEDLPEGTTGNTMDLLQVDEPETPDATSATLHEGKSPTRDNMEKFNTEITVEGVKTPDETHHDVQTLVNVSQSLLSQEDATATEKPNPKGRMLKFFLMLVIGVVLKEYVFAEARITETPSVVSPPVVAETGTTETVDPADPDHETEIMLIPEPPMIVEEFIEPHPLGAVNNSNEVVTEGIDSLSYDEGPNQDPKEEQTSDESSLSAWQMAIIVAGAMFTLRRRSSMADHDSVIQPESNDIMSHISVDTNVDDLPDPMKCPPSPRTPKNLLPGYNLTYYSDLKMTQLRELLRTRNCSIEGKKGVVIARLAAVYKSELETLTVKQLRPMLKSRGLKQVTYKSEMIQRLVEAGMDTSSAPVPDRYISDVTQSADHPPSPISSEVVLEYDFVKYNQLKVVDLRELLRERRCSVAGRKETLIIRLATVYKTELETMTVKQLMPKLKSRKLKLQGKKHELVQRLVEAGI